VAGGRADPGGADCKRGREQDGRAVGQNVEKTG